MRLSKRAISWRLVRALACVVLVLAVQRSTFAQAREAAAKPLPEETLSFLEQKKIGAAAPVYIRIFKEE